MVRNILNQSAIKVYTNTLDNGEATEIIQIGATSQTKCNVSFKSNTTEDTSPSSSDLLLTADALTGKILKYGSIRNVINSHIWKDVAKNAGQTGDNIVLVDSTNDSVVIGPDGGNNANNRRLLVVGATGQVALEVFKDVVFRDGVVQILSDCKLHINSNSTFRYIFVQNTGLLANRNINIPLLSNDGTMMIDETNVGLKLVNNLIKSGNDSNILLDATTSEVFVVGNTTDELRLTSKSTGVKLMPDKLIDSGGLNLLSKVSGNYSVGSGTSGYMLLNSGAVRLGNNQLSDSGGGSFINKNGTLITLGNTSNTLVLDSLATGVQVAKGLLFTGANNNLISTVGSVTNVGYASNSYTQLSGTHVRLGSNILNDSAGVNLLSKSGTAITIGSAGVTTTINGTFQSTDIAFLNVVVGASKKLYYTFSGSATEYDFLKITRDATTDANSVINVGNTTHQVKFNANDNAGITLQTQGGIRAPSGKNIIKYVESLGIYSNTVGNGFDDISVEGLDVTITATSLGTPSQFLIGNTNGVILGSENKLLTLRASTSIGIRLESFLKNSNNRTQLEYDALNTTNIYGTRSTDKTELRGTEVDIVSSADIDFFVSASHPFDTYSVKIDSTGNIKFNNDSGIAQSIRTRANNNLIGINSAQNTVDVGSYGHATNMISSTGINLYTGSSTQFLSLGNGNVVLKNNGNSGAIFGDKTSSNLWNTTTITGNVFNESAFLSGQLYLRSNRMGSDANGLFQLFSQGNNTYRFECNASSVCQCVNFVSTSDERIKKDIVQINDYDDLSNKFDAINLYEYAYQNPYAYDKRNERTEEGLNKRVVGWVAQNVKANFAQAVTVTQEYYDDETGEYIPDTYVNEETGERLEIPNQLNVDKSTLNLTLWGKVKKMNEIINTLTEKVNHLEQIIQNNNLS